ncbi:plasmid stabilization protein [Pulveribacter sp.]|uniref:plasmid stabilization protein n=1 Tax=Pulveribacter sp. TaxID=2678893 RepID=UPI0028AF8C75|nr:plasmid stabilization protein [Pulveribacter sp.]
MTSSIAPAARYENANYLRELAENLLRLLPGKGAAKAELLQRLASEELTQAEYDERILAKVAAARADKRSGMSTDQLRQALKARAQELRNVL